MALLGQKVKNLPINNNPSEDAVLYIVDSTDGKIELSSFRFFLDIEYDVFIVAGQSNTNSASWGFDSSLDEFSELSSIFQLNRANPGSSAIGTPEIIPLTTPLKHYSLPSTIPGYKPWQNNFVGFDRYFAREYIKNGNLAKGKKVLLIPCGRPGSSFSADNWGIGNPNYLDVIAMAQWVQSNLPKSQIKGLLWHQGESDVGNANWQAESDAQFTSIRSVLGLPNLPIVVGGMAPIWVRQNSSRIPQQNLIRQTPYRLNYVAYADPERPTWMTPLNGGDTGDDIHYDVPEQRQLGEKYYEGWRRALNADGIAKPPESPSLIKGSASSNGTVTLRFPEPQTNGAAITSYSVRQWSGSSPAFNAASTASTITDRGESVIDGMQEITVTGLTAGTFYSFQVSATNSAGQGPWSSEIQVTPIVVTSSVDASTPWFLLGDSFYNRGTSGAAATITGRGIMIGASEGMGQTLYAHQTAALIFSGYTPAASTAFSISVRFQAKNLNHTYFNVASQQWLIDSNTIRSLISGSLLYLGFGAAPTLVNLGSLIEGKWYHLYIGWNGSTVLTYSLDNATSATVAVSGGTSPTEIALLGNMGGGAFFGGVRDIRIHSRELTAPERTALYSAITPPVTGSLSLAGNLTVGGTVQVTGSFSATGITSTAAISASNYITTPGFRLSTGDDSNTVHKSSGNMAITTGGGTVSIGSGVGSSHLIVSSTAITTSLPLIVGSNAIRITTAKTPASASAAGTTGDICWDSSYIYVCVATNTWKRTAISTW